MIKKSLIAVGIALVLYVAYYLISPVFVTVHLDEEVPVELPAETKVVEVDVNSGDDSSSPTSSVVVGEVNTTVSPESSKSAPVVGTSGHPSSGEVRVIKTAQGEVLRYENFKTINGPDLYVYLAKDLEATDFVNLGELKATEGNINYSIPAGVDSTDYRYALVWCKQFGVLFSSADLSLASL